MSRPGVEEGYLAGASTTQPRSPMKTPEGSQHRCACERKIRPAARERNVTSSRRRSCRSQRKREMSGDRPACEWDAADDQHSQRGSPIDSEFCRIQRRCVPASGHKSRRRNFAARGATSARRRGRSTSTRVSSSSKDIVKGGIKERFAQLRKMGIRTVMITGDNPLNRRAAIQPPESGVDDFMAQATDARRQTASHSHGSKRKAVFIAMTPATERTTHTALRASRCRRGHEHRHTQAARERTGNMVDSRQQHPTKLIQIVEIG